MIKKEYKIINETGIHARPATILVQVASRYESVIELEFKNKKINLKSIMGVMSLGISQGSTITITADGTDENDAIRNIENTLKTEGLV
ncbi:phosphocarrier protein HPr [Gemelliphila asaccharolytica]|uniref:Phosphocarrier protein HPr n=1 Tax=Gemelliphila asaccharolytica TaxID=502393 RepID=A0ABR5TMP5_9BACL|nr:phosphocarrier protein HPr [Gemella asaccharolytica]KXB58585.1 phosphocarrier protein HPr [Gemella asaccharolytica]